MGWRRKKTPQDGTGKGEDTPGWGGEGRRHPRMGGEGRRHPRMRRGKEKTPQDGAGQEDGLLLSEAKAEAQEVRKFQES